MVQTGAHASTPEEKLLWGKIQEKFTKAIESGAAKGIVTTEAIEAESSLGVEMVVRIAEVLADKPARPESRKYAESCTYYLCHAPGTYMPCAKQQYDATVISQHWRLRRFCKSRNSSVTVAEYATC